MSTFSLIKQLDAAKPISKLNNINYQSYELVVENQTQKIKIPKRVATQFENEISTLTEQINNTTLKKLLRDFRGIRG
jgi:hypothetical protein